MAKTADDAIDAALTLGVELAEARMEGWQEGDKRGAFIKMDDLAKFLDSAKRIKEDEVEDAATCGVSFLC